MEEEEEGEEGEGRGNRGRGGGGGGGGGGVVARKGKVADWNEFWLLLLPGRVRSTRSTRTRGSQCK